MIVAWLLHEAAAWSGSAKFNPGIPKDIKKYSSIFLHTYIIH